VYVCVRDGTLAKKSNIISYGKRKLLHDNIRATRYYWLRVTTGCYRPTTSKRAGQNFSGNPEHGPTRPVTAVCQIIVSETGSAELLANFFCFPDDDVARAHWTPPPPPFRNNYFPTCACIFNIIIIYGISFTRKRPHTPRHSEPPPRNIDITNINTTIIII